MRQLLPGPCALHGSMPQRLCWGTVGELYATVREKVTIDAE